MSGEPRVRELSARGRGAIRVLELSGPGALDAVQRLTAGPRVAPGEFAPRALRDARGELLDEAIVLVDSPTRVELHLHGAPVLVARVLAELGAGPPEDLPRSIEARAEARLADAASEAAARMLLDQSQGALRAELEALLAREDPALRARAHELARRGRFARRLVEPPRVVLAGAVNAGKSTLFNALVGRERVVVDAAEGTTRDAVHERVALGAYAVELFDTAGERALSLDEASQRVERAGQALAADLRRTADLVLWLVRPGGEAPSAGAEHARVVVSCADLAPAGVASGRPALSARRAPLEARGVVEEVVRSALGLPPDPWMPGAGVPFEVEWIDELERGDPARLRRAIPGWLAAAPAD